MRIVNITSELWLSDEPSNACIFRTLLKKYRGKSSEWTLFSCRPSSSIAATKWKTFNTEQNLNRLDRSVEQVSKFCTFVFDCQVFKIEIKLVWAVRSLNKNYIGAIFSLSSLDHKKSRREQQLKVSELKNSLFSASFFFKFGNFF